VVSKFSPAYARTFKKRRESLGDTWYSDGVYIVTVLAENGGTCGVPWIRVVMSSMFLFKSARTSGLRCVSSRSS
jgi:hypothetical protein